MSTPLNLVKHFPQETVKSSEGLLQHCVGSFIFQNNTIISFPSKTICTYMIILVCVLWIYNGFFHSANKPLVELMEGIVVEESNFAFIGPNLLFLSLILIMLFH